MDVPKRYLMTEAAREDLRQRLFANLKANLPQLTSLCKECNSHWGYEDPVYRYYHGSFKVFFVQSTTVKIVRALASLDPEYQLPDSAMTDKDPESPLGKYSRTEILPDAPLNTEFMEIMRAGTGKSFKYEHNRNWAAEVRPIIEALFHARFMLEMAVKYAEAPDGPRLKSGLAAFLYLYDLR